MKGAGEGVQLEMKVGRQPELPLADNPSPSPDNTPPYQPIPHLITHLSSDNTSPQQLIPHYNPSPHQPLT